MADGDELFVELPLELLVNTRLKLPDSVNAHEFGAMWAKLKGVVPESPEYLDRVDAWRNAWRPKRVRFVIVAESHVRQHKGDLEVKVQLPFETPESLPSGYVRLVYCPGYGESEICNHRNPNWPNSGTPPFWRMFSRMAALKENCSADAVERLRWKLNVLRKLRDAGIWLLDAVVFGVYYDATFRAPTTARIIQQSFSTYVWPKVEREPIEQIWLMGKSQIAPALSSLPAIRDRVRGVIPLTPTDPEYDRAVKTLVKAARKYTK